MDPPKDKRKVSVSGSCPSMESQSRRIEKTQSRSSLPYRLYPTQQQSSIHFIIVKGSGEVSHTSHATLTDTGWTAHALSRGRHMHLILWPMCVHTHALSLENDICTRKDEKKVNWLTDLGIERTGKIWAMGLYFAKKKSDTEEVRKWKHYLNNYALSLNTRASQAPRDPALCWSQMLHWEPYVYGKTHVALKC